MGKKEDLRVHETLEQTQRSGHVPCPQSFPTSWHSAGLGINRRACCAPRMHVCRVPISEYTVIGLPEGPYLTFRLQVAGHSIAHPSSASAINPFLAHFSRHKPKQRQIKSQEDYVMWPKGPKTKNGLCAEIILSTTLSNIGNEIWSSTFFFFNECQVKWS